MHRRDPDRRSTPSHAPADGPAPVLPTRAAAPGPFAMSAAAERFVRTCTRCVGVCEESHRRGFDLIRRGRQDCAGATLAARDCADFCQLAIRLVLRCSDLMATALHACADACAGCTEACRRCDGGPMDRCVEACTECEAACLALCCVDPPRHKGGEPPPPVRRP